MSAAAINSREQALAGGLAFATHVLFLILMVFGVSWQHKQIDTAVVVDLWRDLPTVATPPAAEAPPPPQVKPEPPPPAPKVEAKPPPKPEPVPVAKPDIALKDKQEKERKLKEQQATEEKKKLAAEKAREEEIEKKKRAETDALKKKQAADAAAKSAVAEQAKMQAAEAAQRAAAAKGEIDKYMDGIRTKVRRFVLVPPSLQGNPEAEASVTLLPGGEVLDVRISKSSGNPAYDAAIESAIRKAQPFTVPTGDLFQQNFRRFTMVFRPVQ
jgi:colicin import membrane protein